MSKFLKTKHLTMRLTGPCHFEDIFKLRSDPDVQRHTTQGIQSREDVEQFMKTVLPYQKNMAMVWLAYF